MTHDPTQPTDAERAKAVATFQRWADEDALRRHSREEHLWTEEWVTGEPINAVRTDDYVGLLDQHEDAHRDNGVHLFNDIAYPHSHLPAELYDPYEDESTRRRDNR